MGVAQEPAFLILWRNPDFFNCFLVQGGCHRYKSSGITGEVSSQRKAGPLRHILNGLTGEVIFSSKKSSHSLLHAVTRWWLRETKGNEHGVACWRRTRERGFLASANHVVAAEITLFNMEKCLSWLNAGMCRPRVCLPCQAQLFARAGASQSCLCLFCFTTASPTTITATPTPIATAAATASTAAASYCCCYCYFFRCDY